MYKAILLDLDGTLLDTTPGVLYAVKYTIKELELRMPTEDILKLFVGPPMQLSFERHFGMAKDKALECANLFRKNYKRKSLLKANLYPFVLETLDVLRREKYKLAVATNKSHDNAMKILEYFGILDYCDCAMGSDCGGNLKKADIIKECLMKLDETPECSVYIGDSIFDLEGAEAVGMDFIAATYGFGFNKETTFTYKRIAGIINAFSDLTKFNFGLVRGPECDKNAK